MATLGRTLRGVAGAYARRRGVVAVARDGVAVGSCGLRRLSSKDAGALSSNGVGASLRKVFQTSAKESSIGHPAVSSVGDTDSTAMSDISGSGVSPSGQSSAISAAPKPLKQTATTTAASREVARPAEVPAIQRDAPGMGGPAGSRQTNASSTTRRELASPLPSPFPQGHYMEFAPRIMVIGCGGAGGNAVNNMIARNLQGVEFMVCNTDAQHLSTTQTDNRLQLGRNVTDGLGCGANPDLGRKAALESKDELLEMISGSHMVFIAAGMGGGTGTGAAPVIAEACMESGILTVAVVTKPFLFEGTHRMRLAQEGIKFLQSCVDTLIVIPNENLFNVVDDQTSFFEAFRMADDVLLAGVRSVTDLMVRPGLTNLDFADVRSVMAGMGNAMMGSGEAEGEGRALEATKGALCNPLLGEVSIKTAKGVLVNITGGADMTLREVGEASRRITTEVEDDTANMIFGSAYDSTLEGKIRVSVVATGIDSEAVSG